MKNDFYSDDRGCPCFYNLFFLLAWGLIAAFVVYIRSFLVNNGATVSVLDSTLVVALATFIYIQFFYLQMTPSLDVKILEKGNDRRLENFLDIEFHVTNTSNILLVRKSIKVVFSDFSPWSVHVKNNNIPFLDFADSKASLLEDNNNNVRILYPGNTFSVNIPTSISDCDWDFMLVGIQIKVGIPFPYWLFYNAHCIFNATGMTQQWTKLVVFPILQSRTTPELMCKNVVHTDQGRTNIS